MTDISVGSLTGDFIRNKQLVSVYLCNGVKLTGVILAVSEDGSVVLEKDGCRQAVYGRAISTIMPWREQK